ncbi:expressed unknown protein [Seminavis robusta]|uniref:Uncharacterized protein n=1 Tax=Seminavis robusta TaxID=568900 RepID=A0A9N8H012_9STRA|nr:expressed unknown protein [Seminavis robusta]|eukprot:Sro12_g009470.1 n/a (122) ;mRNA; f:133610-133975
MARLVVVLMAVLATGSLFVNAFPRNKSISPPSSKFSRKRVILQEQQLEHEENHKEAAQRQQETMSSTNRKKKRISPSLLVKIDALIGLVYSSLYIIFPTGFSGPSNLVTALLIVAHLLVFL